MITQAINIAISGRDLEYDTAKKTMEEIMDGQATHAQIASFLTAMRMKGESINEITACASAMRDKGIRICPEGEVMDIVGTGGDEAGTFNISTTTAFVVAAGGVPVAKHGNRSVSSKSGAADVLEQLGVKIQLDARQSQKILKTIGLCFLFAPVYHSSMKHAAPVRKEIGVRTIFNILGPLANPAGASMQLMGVFKEELAAPLAQVMVNLGVNRGMVIYGKDGLDEATLTEETKIVEINGDTLKTYHIAPEDFGFSRCGKEELVGGDAAENAIITKNILNGTEQGAKRDVVLLNAGLALYLAGKGETVAACIALAAELIDNGKALAKLEEFVKLSNEVMQ